MTDHIDELIEQAIGNKAYVPLHLQEYHCTPKGCGFACSDLRAVAEAAFREANLEIDRMIAEAYEAGCQTAQAIESHDEAGNLLFKEAAEDCVEVLRTLAPDFYRKPLAKMLKALGRDDGLCPVCARAKGSLHCNH